ncbi:MAG: hypothetical protein CMJ65_02005 [Planctomycetaceae bacterium]|jgi:hypothetical protein|nr:hypothetical protein [Planctomycetaceae bacterium]MDP7276056.1 hypothetical protein [Planctomycetaceae bacterium]
MPVRDRPPHWTLCRLRLIPVAACLLVLQATTLLLADDTTLLKRRYDETCFLVTHNAMSNRAQGWLFPNQNFGLSRQLKDGVRGLMLDVHLVDGRPFLVHGKPFLGKRPLVDGLKEIGKFLNSSPQAVITIVFESYVDGKMIQHAFRSAGLLESLHHQRAAEPWPRLQQMITANRRLVVFTDRDGGQWPGYHDVWKFCWETHFSIRRAEEFSFRRNRGRSSNGLLILNHFLTRTFGSATLAGQANTEAVLGPRVRQCRARTGRVPNFVVVDFYDIGDARRIVKRFNHRD